MNTIDCITTRRSIRKFQSKKVPHDIIKKIVAASAYAPSWKNTQITRYIAVEDASILETITNEYTPDYNSKITGQAPLVIAVTAVKYRCGYERDGSFSTVRGDTWQMFDTGIAAATFCLAANDYGIGTVIMGIFDYKKTAALLELPGDQELIALIAAGYPDIDPPAPKRKDVDTLLSFK